jgi:hypothetical protein
MLCAAWGIYSSILFVHKSGEVGENRDIDEREMIIWRYCGPFFYEPFLCIFSFL